MCVCGVKRGEVGVREEEGEPGWVNELRVGSYSHNKEKKKSRKKTQSLPVSLSAYNFHSLAFSIESQ